MCYPLGTAEIEGALYEMTNRTLLKARLAESGVKMKDLAKHLSISRTTLWRKTAGRLDFRTEEVTATCQMLGIDKEDRERIFFTREVSNPETKAGE